MKIKFIQAFSSTTFGNVYLGKEVDVKKNVGEKLINDGFAEEVKSNDGQSDNTGSSKKPFKSKRKSGR